MPVLSSWRGLFLAALLLRSTSLLSQTFFQPDEFFQALEPAHHLVFGYGQLTWEWRNLPGLAEDELGQLPRWKQVLLEWSGRRLRGWLWPSVFAVLYWALKTLRLDGTRLLILVPRILLVIVAAATDCLTAHLSARLFDSPLAPRISLLLSLTSLFNHHALPRALSTSFETFLAALALCWWPLPQSRGQSWLSGALVCAGMGVMVRPTSGVFWVPMGAMLLQRRAKAAGLSAGLRTVLQAVLIGSIVLAASTALDYFITRTWSFPLLAFLAQNVALGVSSFYGTSPWHYHLSQSLPILLTTAVPFVAMGVCSTLSTDDKRALGKTKAETALRELLLSSAVTIAAFSLISHKEWRFLHFILPVLLQFAVACLIGRAPPGSNTGNAITVNILGLTRGTALYFVLVPLAPALYLSHCHGRAQVGVAEQLRLGLGSAAGRSTSSVAVLMPCHSIPGMSHVHRSDLRDGALWSLGCEPPIGVVDCAAYQTEAQRFYANATNSLAAVLAGHWQSPHGVRPIPQQVVCFGDLLHEGRAATLEREYSQTWYCWNGFDPLQDEAERRGGVYLWTRREVL